MFDRDHNDDDDIVELEIEDGVAGDDDDDDVEVVAEGDDDDDDSSGDRLELDQRHDDDVDPKEKLSRKDRRARQRQRAKGMKTEREALISAQSQEIAQLHDRLARLEGRAAQSDNQSLDGAIQNIARALAHTEDVLAEAVETGDGTKVKEAMRQRDRLIVDQNRALALKHNREQEAKKPQQRGPDPIVKALGEAFLEDHPWVDINDKNDPDSVTVMRIDEQLRREGYNAKTQDYWDELAARTQKYVPHRFGRRQQEQRVSARRGPPVATSGSRSGTTTTGSRRLISFQMTPERRQILSELNVSKSDPEYIAHAKYFADYDRQNPPSSGTRR